MVVRFTAAANKGESSYVRTSRNQSPRRIVASYSSQLRRKGNTAVISPASLNCRKRIASTGKERFPGCKSLNINDAAT
jgi:hypothetical protein